MKQEMVSTPVDNAPAFLQLRDKYKQELVEDTRLTKAVDLAAKQHVLLAKMLPMHGNDLNSKPWGVNYAIGSKKYAKSLVPRSVACAPRAPTSPGKDDFDAGPVQAWSTQLVKTAQGIKQSASPGGPSRPGRKPSVPPTTSTQSRGASITPLDQKSTPKAWCPGQWRARHGRPRPPVRTILMLGQCKLGRRNWSRRPRV